MQIMLLYVGMENLNAIILHGLQRRAAYYATDQPSPSNTGWIPWLQKQLAVRDISTQTPDMPRAWRPDYKLWSEVLNRQLLIPDTLVVAHSCGAGFFLQWLTLHSDKSAGHVFLVAPWLGVPSDYEDDPEDGQVSGGMFDFTLSPGVLDRVKSLTIYNSLTDRPYILKSVAKIRQAIPSIGYREFEDMGHFTSAGMERDSFDELLHDIDMLMSRKE